MLPLYKEKFQLVHSAHLYKNSAEGSLKIVVLIASWLWGVQINLKHEDVDYRNVVIALFLFSLTLLLEAIVQVLSEIENNEKRLPFLISLSSIFIFFLSVNMIMTGDFDEKLVNGIITFINILLGTISFDVCSQIFDKKQSMNVTDTAYSRVHKYPENNLKSIHKNEKWGKF